jgi:hypothetical protein
VRIDGRDLLLDTGVPTSFGELPCLTVGSREFHIASSYLGLTPDVLSEHLGQPAAGVLGMDLLCHFDILIDVQAGQIAFSEDPLDFPGEGIEIETFMGIPTIEVSISSERHRMVFDTGAQISYWQDDALQAFPSAGVLTDFFPGLGRFESDTFQVEMILGGSAYRLRCGRLPELLGMALAMTGADGIVGNEILKYRTAAFLPRSSKLVINSVKKIGYCVKPTLGNSNGERGNKYIRHR